MGIKGLFPHLKKFDNGGGETVALSDLPAIIRKERKLDNLACRMIGVDVSLVLYKALFVNENYWLSIFISRIMVMQNAGLVPVCIFDGVPPPEKDACRQSRRDEIDKKKNKIQELNELLDDIVRLDIDDDDGSNVPEDIMERVKLSLPKTKGDKKVAVGELTGELVWSEAMTIIRSTLAKKEKTDVAPTPEMIDAIKSVLKAMGLPIVQAEGEAEIYASWLCCHGQLGSVWSDDGDCLCVGCPYILNKVDDGKGQLFRYRQLLETLEVTPRMFRDFCIMLGCDYNDHQNVQGFGPVACWDLIVKYRSISNIPEFPEIPRIGNKRWNSDCLDYKNCRRLFTVPEKMKNMKFTPREMDETKLMSILVRYNCNKSMKAFRSAYENMAKGSQV